MSAFFRYHIFDDALDIVQTCHWLRGSLWLFGNTAYLSTKMFSMPFFSFWQMGMLGGGHSVCSTCCCLLHVVHAFTNFTFCFSWVSFWSSRKTFLSFTSSSVISFGRRCTRYRPSSRYRPNIGFVTVLGDDHALCDTNGSLRCDQLFYL